MAPQHGNGGAPQPHDDILQQLLAQIERRVVEEVGSTKIMASSAIADAATQQADDRRSSHRVLYGGGGIVLTMVATLSGWVMEKADAWGKEQAASIQQTESIKNIEAKLRMVSHRQRVGSEELIESDRAIHAAFEWMGDKADAISPRARRFKMPDDVKDLGRRKLNPIFEVTLE